MRWQQGRRSENVENRRGLPVRTAAGGGGLLIAAFLVYLSGGDPVSFLLQNIQPAGHASSLTPEEEKEQADFVSVVLASTEDAWTEILAEPHQAYHPPKLVLFSDRVDTACGAGQAAAGPFYCPNDQNVYLDLSFFHDLQYRFGAPGDFARAYVIAHEIGHHVQNMTGLLQKSHPLEGSASEADANRLSVAVELQADCYAGLWAHYAELHNMIEPGDIAEALKAASQIGDDTLQRETQGYIVPDSFTHGTSAQRYASFNKGYSGGTVKACAQTETR